MRTRRGKGVEDCTEEKNKAETVELQCVICLLKCPASSVVAKLDCGHMFHLRCAKTWLARRATCPVCRQLVELDQSTGQGKDSKEFTD
eukprot:g73094.t1